MADVSCLACYWRVNSRGHLDPDLDLDLGRLSLEDRVDTEAYVLSSMLPVERTKYLKQLPDDLSSLCESAMLKELPIEEMSLHVITRMTPAASEAFISTALTEEERAYVHGLRLLRMFPKQREAYLMTLTSDQKLHDTVAMLTQMQHGQREGFLKTMSGEERVVLERGLSRSLSPEDWMQYMTSLTPQQRAVARGQMLVDMRPTERSS